MNSAMKALLENISTMNTVDLNIVAHAVKLQRSTISKATTHSLSTGDRVSFKLGDGRIAHGTVGKVNIKTVIVSADNGSRYKVPGGLLTILAKETV